MSYLAPAIRDNFPLKIRLATFKLFTEIESAASIRVPLPFSREVESDMDYNAREELDWNKLKEPSTFEMKLVPLILRVDSLYFKVFPSYAYTIEPRILSDSRLERELRP